MKRDLSKLSAKEMLTTPPTREESKMYIYNWYKQREKDYGDMWKDEKEMYDLGDFYLERWMKLVNAKELHELILEAEESEKNNPNIIRDGEFDTYSSAGRLLMMATMAKTMLDAQKKKKKRKVKKVC